MRDDIELTEVIEGLTQITEENLPELFKITPFHGIHDGSKLIGLRQGFAHVYPGDYIWDLGFGPFLIAKDDLKRLLYKGSYCPKP